MEVVIFTPEWREGAGHGNIREKSSPDRAIDTLKSPGAGWVPGFRTSETSVAGGEGRWRKWVEICSERERERGA